MNVFIKNIICQNLHWYLHIQKSIQKDDKLMLLLRTVFASCALYSSLIALAYYRRYRICRYLFQGTKGSCFSKVTKFNLAGEGYIFKSFWSTFITWCAKFEKNDMPLQALRFMTLITRYFLRKMGSSQYNVLLLLPLRTLILTLDSQFCHELSLSTLNFAPKLSFLTLKNFPDISYSWSWLSVNLL